jgi:hypothetical protein
MDVSSFNLSQLLELLALLIPSASGALLGGRYKVAQTWREKVVGFITSVASGFYLGGALGAFLGFPPVVTWGLMFSLGALGTEIVAYLFALLREGVISPTNAAGRWVDILLGRRRDADKNERGPDTEIKP